MTAPSRVLLALTVVASFGWACSLQSPEFDDCVDDDTCRVAFGPGSVCQSSGRCSDPTTCSDDSACRAVFGFGSTCQDGRCSPVQTFSRCTRTYPEDLFERPEAYVDRLLIGALFSYRDHLDTLQAAELAVRQVNRVGGLGERAFAMVTCDYTDNTGDSLDSLAATAAATEYLVQTLGVSAIVGPRGSDRTQVAFEAGAGRALIISPSATSALLTELDGAEHSDESPGLLWRTAASDTVQAGVIADDMLERGTRHVAVVMEEGIYGEGLADLFIERFEAGVGDGSVIDTYPFRGDNFLAATATVGASAAEEVLFISPDIGRITGFLNAAAANPSLLEQYLQKRLFLTDAGANRALIDNVTADAQQLFTRLRGTRPASTIGTPLYNFFSAAYEREFPGSDAESAAFNPHSYDAAWLIIDGVAWAHYNETDITPVTIARGLRRLSAGDAVDVGPSDWPDVLAAFAEGRSIDIRGTSGDLDYDPVTEETTTQIELWTVAEHTGGGYVIRADTQ